MHVVAACTLLGAAGCQQYERHPLDLAAHRAALDRRLDEVDRLEDFARRLTELGASAPAVLSFEDGITSAEGEVAGLFYNADLRRARLEAGVALASYETAGLWEDPVFGFDGAEIWSPSSPFELGLMVNLTIPVSGRLEVEKERAGAAYETELRRIVDAEWAMRFRVRGAWAAWTVEEERVRLLRDVVARMEPVAAISGRLEAVGELSRTEARLLRIELAKSRAALSGAELAAHAARIELLGLMGFSPDAPAELVPGLPAAEPAPDGDAVDRLIASSTELAVRRAEYRVAEETVRLEIRKQFPDITIGTGYGNEGDQRLLLGVAIPIPILNANRAAIAEARARREVARASAEITLERLTRELAAARARLAAAGAQREQYESVIVPMLAEQWEEIVRIADLGEVRTLLLIETITESFDASARLLDLRLAELRAGLSIARLLGPDTAADPAPVTPTPEQPSSVATATGGVQ
jgi:outer membrane protein TolC